MNTPIKPMGNRILSKPIKEEVETMKGGIVIPDASQKEERSTKYEVLEVGCGEEIEKLGLQVGDVVIVNKYTGGLCKHDGVDYRLIPCNDIQGKIK